MIPMHTVYLMIVVVFALIGSLRGWAKEIIVAFSVVLALFIEQVLTSLVPPVRDLWADMQPLNRFWIQVAVFAVIVIFGYASPTVAQRIGAKVVRERLQDILLGFFIGLLNGLLIVGTVWFYIDEAYYGVDPIQVLDAENAPVFDEEWRRIGERTFDHYGPEAKGLGGVQPPQEGTTAWNVLPYLPPRVVTETYLYLAVGLAFVFVIIVFI